MFKLVAVLALVAVVSAKPGFLAPAVVPAIETRTAVIGTQTIESHGNSVVHAAAPVVTGYAAPIVEKTLIAAPAAIHTASVIPTQTIEAHGNSVVHHAAPVVTSYAAAALPVYSSSYLI